MHTLMMSVPLRMPPSTRSGTLLPTTVATAGSMSNGAGAKSTWRPPWLETMMPSTRASMALCASCGDRMPCEDPNHAWLCIIRQHRGASLGL